MPVYFKRDSERKMEQSIKILDAREKRRYKILEYISDYQVVTIKSNIPGINKNIKEAYLLVNYFLQKLLKFNPEKYELFDTIDGPIAYLFFCYQKYLKEETIIIEENDELGRLIDIDVYYHNTSSIKRHKQRKCFLCDKDVFICQREKNHKIEDVLDYVKKMTKCRLSSIIRKEINKAMLEELNLEPKFGLVTKNTNGSHQDMNYDLMIKAKNSLLDGFVSMFFVGVNTNSLSLVFEKIRVIGKEMEKTMFITTSGINCYKGLIFDLGIVLAAVGYKVSSFNNDSVFDIVKSMCKDLSKELENRNDTFGKIAYQKYGITGARGEAESGFENVKNILTQKNPLQMLISLIINVSDTVLLKRAGSIEFYYEVKEKFKQEKDINKLNEWSISNNLSFGGAADLLVVCLFLQNINKVFRLY